MLILSEQPQGRGAFKLKNQARWVSTVPCGEGGFPSPVGKFWGKKKKRVTGILSRLQNKSLQIVIVWRWDRARGSRGEGSK